MIPTAIYSVGFREAEIRVAAWLASLRPKMITLYKLVHEPDSTECHYKKLAASRDKNAIAAAARLSLTDKDIALIGVERDGRLVTRSFVCQAQRDTTWRVIMICHAAESALDFMDVM